MLGSVLFALVLMGFFALLLARYGRPVARIDDPRAPMTSLELRGLAIDLLRAMGWQPLETQDEDVVVATRPEPLGEARFVAVLAPGDVDQAALLEAAESVRGSGATQGMLMSTGEIETAGQADVSLTLVDRRRLRELVAQYLPERLAMLDRHRGFGELATT